MKYLRVILSNVVTVIASVLITLLLAELVLQFTKIGAHSQNRGALFYSTPVFARAGEFAVNYVPDTDIRAVAVYGDLIDYDTTNRTNNLGFYDNIPYGKTGEGVSGLVFLGDSFTAGSGGSRPWVSQLREKLGRQDIQLYSFGVMGTGIFNFYGLLKHYQQDISIHRVDVVAITSDFYRTLWFPHETAEGILFCREQVLGEACEKRFEPTIYTIPIDASSTDILSKAQGLYDSKWLDRDKIRPFHEELRLFKLACNAVHLYAGPSKELLATCPHLATLRGRKLDKNALFNRSIDTLKKMLTEFPEVEFRFFHLPERSEAIAGRYTVHIRNEIEELGLEYIPLLLACDWPLSMYHKHDGHFNDKGYNNLAECMARYIR